jgi:hypothetical protein
MWSPKEPDVARQCVELIRDSYSLPGSEEMRFCSRFFGCLIEGGSQTYRRVGDKARDAVMTGAVDRAAWDSRPAAGGVASKIISRRMGGACAQYGNGHDATRPLNSLNQCRRFEFSAPLAAISFRNFKSKAALES